MDNLERRLEEAWADAGAVASSSEVSVFTTQLDAADWRRGKFQGMSASERRLRRIQRGHHERG